MACGTKDLLTDPLGSLVKELSAGASLGSLIELTPYGTLAAGTRVRKFRSASSCEPRKPNDS